MFVERKEDTNLWAEAVKGKLHRGVEIQLSLERKLQGLDKQ